MNSYADPLWFSSPFYNQHPHLIQTREMLFQPRQHFDHIFHDYKHKLRPIPEMNYSINNHPVSFDSQSSLVYPHEQMININRVQLFRPQSTILVSQSSSGVDIIDDESIEEVYIDRYSSPSLSKSRSRSPFSRRVIIQSNDRIVTTSNKQRRRRRHPSQKTQREKLINEKELMFKRQSALLFARHKRLRSLSERWEHKDEKLKHLFDEYSSEDIQKDWKPLAVTECQELYQYAFDKYQKKSLEI